MYCLFFFLFLIVPFSCSAIFLSLIINNRKNHWQKLGRKYRPCWDLLNVHLFFVSIIFRICFIVCGLTNASLFGLLFVEHNDVFLLWLFCCSLVLSFSNHVYIVLTYLICPLFFCHRSKTSNINFHETYVVSNIFFSFVLVVSSGYLSYLPLSHRFFPPFFKYLQNIPQ